MKKYHLPRTNQNIENVILANGEFPTHPIAISILKNAKYIVCCDGAINSLAETDIVPDAIVGDCDSLSTKNQQRFADIIHRVKEQDTNDLTKAVNFCLNQNRNEIIILGATGKREDHTIGNISLLCEYMKYADVEMVTNYGVFVGIDSNSIFESYAQQQVSLFCIDRCKITTRNLVYAVENHEFTNLWQGTLNEAVSDEFGIETNGWTIVYRTF